MASSAFSETFDPMPSSCPAGGSVQVDVDEGQPVTRPDFWFVILTATAIGFFVAARQPPWIFALESAQVLAGLVKYPSHNSYYIYNMSIMTVIHQFLAAFLWAGVPERLLNFLFHGFCGAFSAVALSLWALALSRDRYIALIPPAILLPLGNLSPLELNYQAAIVPNEFSVYSVFSVSVGLFALGLLGSGRDRTGLLLLAFAPAVHPTGGLWTLGIGVLAMVWGWEQARARLLRRWPYFVLGLVLCASSWGVHRMLTTPVPKLPPEVASQYVDIFVQRWDNHRLPPTAGMVIKVAMVAVSGMAVCALWLRRFRADLSSESLLLLRAYLLGAGMGLMLGVAALWMSALPEMVQRTIPGRFINFALIAHVPLIVGLLGTMKRAWAAAAFLACLAVGANLVIESKPRYLIAGSLCCVLAKWSVSYRQSSSPAAQSAASAPPPWFPILLAMIAIGSFSQTFLLLMIALLLAGFLWKSGRWPTSWPVSFRYATVVLLGLTALDSSSKMIQSLATSYGTLKDWTNNEFFRAAHDGSGMIVSSGSIWPIQLCTRRPVVLIRNLNFIPYFPEGAPDVDRVLRSFFGFGLADPPPEVGHEGMLTREVGREVWEKRSPEEWQRLAEEYQLSGIMTPDLWKLKLPVIAQDFDLTLYGIPKKR